MPRTQNFSPPRKRNFPRTVGRPTTVVRGVRTSGVVSERVIYWPDGRSSLIKRLRLHINTMKPHPVISKPHPDYDGPRWLRSLKPSPMGGRLTREILPSRDGRSEERRVGKECR